MKEKVPSQAGHKHSYYLDASEVDSTDPRFVYESFVCANPGCPKPRTIRRVRK